MQTKRRSISVTEKQFRELARWKRIYAGYHGLPVTWGKFLTDVSVLGVTVAYAHAPQSEAPSTPIDTE